MKKQIVSSFVMILAASFLFSSCAWHKHDLGEWQFNGSGHFQECSCGYTIAQSSSKHIDEDKDEACDICGYEMKYEINSLSDLAWYLLYYYEISQYEYLQESNMKAHSIHEYNFKNTLTYNERQVRVSFDYPYFNEYLTGLPRYEEYVKSNTEYYSRDLGSGYVQVDTPASYYLFETQEQIRYGVSDQYCDYERFLNSESKFKTVNDFYETTSYLELTKKIYPDSASYEEDSLSFKHEIMHSVREKILYLVRYYLNVELQEDYGELVLPDMAYFDNLDIKTENKIVYFSVEKNDGNTFFSDDIRYSIHGQIDLKTHNLSYNVKESYYFDGEIMTYVDYDYDLSLTDEPIHIEFDNSGDFEEINMKDRW